MVVPILLSVIAIGLSVLSMLFAAGVYFRLARMIRSTDDAADDDNETLSVTSAVVDMQGPKGYRFAPRRRLK